MGFSFEILVTAEGFCETKKTPGLGRVGVAKKRDKTRR
jgi:hypothetical protein